MAKVPVHPTKQSASIRVDVPPRERKRPRQSRSVALVAALKETACEIIAREGRDALTLQRLSDYSGVAASSIYEYFPQIDALVGAILADSRDAGYRELLHRLRQLPDTATLFDGIELAVSELLQIRHRLLQLDPHMEARSLHFSELQRLDLVSKEPAAHGFVAQELAARFPREVAHDQREKRLYLFTQTVQAVIRIVALERPGYLVEPDTVQLLARMLHSLLAVTPEPVTPCRSRSDT